MRSPRHIAIAATAILAAIQVVRPPRVNPPSTGEALVAPPAVESVLRRACADCHSNQTRWPWYSGLAPLSWLVAHDVSEGRRRLNFSDWSAYADDPETEVHKLDEIAQAVARGDMAPWYYRLLHREAHLDPADRDLLLAWVRSQSHLAASHAAIPTS